MRRALLVLPIALLLSSCGSDSDKSDTAKGGSTTAAATTVASVPVAPSAAPLTGGKTIKGTGYTVDVPSGWRDGSAALKGSAIKFDNAYLNPKGEVPKENIIVIRETPPGVEKVTLPALDQQFRAQASINAKPGTLSATLPATLDGNEADTYTYAMKTPGINGRQRQLFAIHDGAIYTITWTAPAKGFDESSELFDRILAGWHWT